MFSCIIIVSATFIVLLQLLLCTYTIAFTLMPFKFLASKIIISHAYLRAWAVLKINIVNFILLLRGCFYLFI